MIPIHVTHPDPNVYMSDDYLVLDVENTIVDGDGSPVNPDVSLVLSCIEDPQGNREHWWGDQYHVEELLERIRSVGFVVAHNAKHELQWLVRCGLDISQLLVYDTMLGEYVLAGNGSPGLGLGVVSKRYGYGGKEAYVDLCMKAGICPTDMPQSRILKRCSMDVTQTHGIFLAQRDKLQERDQLKTLYTRCLLTPVLADIEFTGMHLDKEKVYETYNSHMGRFEKLGGELKAITGEVNLRSNKQLAELLYDTLGFSELTDRRGNPSRTGAGARRTDTGTIGQLKASTKGQRDFLGLWEEYNQLGAALSKNLEFFKAVCDEKDSTFLGVFNQSVTQTHRLSSSGRKTSFKCLDRPKGVQFQNLPRTFKSLFSPRRDGWKMAEADGAQLEFRVAVDMGKDKQGYQDIISGSDRHRYTASILNEIPEEEVTSALRQDAKAETFKPLYGGTYGTPKQMAYYKAFGQRYPGITGWQNNNKYHVLTHKQLTIPSGLTFYWPDTTVNKYDEVTNATQICNYPVQSFATADIIPIAITYLWHYMQENNMESFMVNTVHDSVIVELHPDEQELFSELATKAFTDTVYWYLDTVYDYKFSVPLAAGIKIGTHWNTGEETTHEKQPEWKLI